MIFPNFSSWQFSTTDSDKIYEFGYRKVAQLGAAVEARKWPTLLPESGIDRMTFGIGVDEEDILSTPGPKRTGGPDD